MGVEAIKKEMQVFEASVKNLSSSIGQASALWSDEKYSELSKLVGEIANQSRDVLISGEKACSAVEKFSSIAHEKY